MRYERLWTRHHVAVIDHADRLGVGLASAPSCDCASCLALWWEDREDMDAELRVLGYAVAALLGAPDGEGVRFVVRPVEPEWSCDGVAVRPWGPDALTVADTPEDWEIRGELWRALDWQVQLLDQDAERRGR